MISCPQCGTSYPPTVRLCPRDGTVLESPVPTEERLVGVVLHGKYRLDSYLSSGGMGAVFRATHVMLGKPVAVKLIKGDLVTSPEMARRFQREARAATSLNHPSIVSVYDLGQTDDGTLYIAMELVDGHSLKEEIRAQGRIDPPRLVRLLRQVASALAVAHRAQIIHRDLKPQNVMLTRDSSGQEFAKLLDFGIAKTFDDAQTQLTQAGFALGTPQYMSPEQARGEEVDGRSDIYSLGVVMYEMLIGEVPFTAPSTSGILVKHMTEMPAPPSARRPDIRIPGHLEAIALRCLEKEPANRFQTADEFATALDAEAVPEPTRPMPAAVDATTVLVGPSDVAPTPAATAAATVAGATAAGTSGAAPSPAAAQGPAIPESQTRPTVPAAAVPAGAPAASRSAFGAFGAIAAVILLMAALGGVLWLFAPGAKTDPDQTIASGEATPPDTTPATALPAADAPAAADTPAPATPEPQPTADSPAAPASTSQPADAGPSAGGAGPTGGSGSTAAGPATSTPPPPAKPTPPAPGKPPAPQTAAAATGAAQGPPPAEPAVAAPAPAAAVPAAMPAEPSVFIECRGAGEVCGAVRAAFDQALQRERLAIARSSDRADIVLIATVTLIDERREQQFGQTMAVRTYSIEVIGDAPRLDRVIPMPSPRTFSFDQRFGAERANENARVVAMDAVGRVRAFIKKN